MKKSLVSIALIAMSAVAIAQPVQERRGADTHRQKNHGLCILTSWLFINLQILCNWLHGAEKKSAV